MREWIRVTGTMSRYVGQVCTVVSRSLRPYRISQESINVTRYEYVVLDGVHERGDGITHHFLVHVPDIQQIYVGINDPFSADHDLLRED